MPQNQHALFRENIPAYALGALDADDSAALAAHLKTCVSCRDELAVYQALSAGLLIALPPQNPPACLQQRLRNKLPSARKTSTGLFKWSFNQSALAIGFAALLLLNIFTILQLQSFQRQQARLSNQLQSEQTAMALLSYPDTQTLLINSQNVTGTVLLDKDRNTAVIILWNLVPIADNQTYQIWLVAPNGDRTSAGLFRPEADQPFTSIPVFSKQALSGFSGIGATLEPFGGSSHPTGLRLFNVNF
ncbi:MAG: anti-sigma factor [Anaerolineales bacterium]